MQNDKSAPESPRFPFGVAGHAVAADCAVIWTRLAVGDGQPRAVVWEVYAEGELEPTRHGLFLASPAEEFSVRVEVTGLQPRRRYRFGFQVDGEASPLGEFATAARREAAGCIAA